MEITAILQGKRKEIMTKWFSLAISYFPEESRPFLCDVSNVFQNPVGANIYSTFNAILDAVLSGNEIPACNSCLTDLIKIGAVQEMPASKFIQMLFLLKRVITDELKGNKPIFLSEVSYLYGMIDQIALHAFDIFLECKEKIFALQFRELARFSEKLATMRE